MKALPPRNCWREGVLLGQGADGQVIPPSLDLEPEYIAVNGEGTKAYVTLQEANAIGVLDLETASFTAVKGLGFVDYSREENAADLIEDNAYAPKTYENTLGVRMPDGIRPVRSKRTDLSSDSQ